MSDKTIVNLLKELEEAKKTIKQQQEVISKQQKIKAEDDMTILSLKKDYQAINKELDKTSNELSKTKEALLSSQEELAKAYRLLEKQLSEKERKNEIIKKNNYEKFFSKSESTSKLLKKSRSVKSIEKHHKVGRKKGSKNYNDILNLKPDEIIELEPQEFIKAINKDDFIYLGGDTCYKINRIKARYSLTQIVRKKYLDKKTNKIYQPLSNFVFGNSIITPSFVSNAIYLKYCLCLPINKLSKHIKQEMGINISNVSWWNYFDKTSELLTPIYDGIKQALITNDAHIIQADETTVSISKLDQNQNKSYVLVATSTYYSNPICFYKFINERKPADSIEIFNNFKGYLVCDAFSGYNKINKINKDIKIQRCWVHARRYVANSIKVSDNPKIPQINLLKEINKLFEIEDQISNKSLKEIYSIRNDKSRQILENIKSICDKNQNSKIDSFNKAIKYILNNFEELSTFLLDARIPIHNNKSERTINYFVQARKNFQTIATIESAQKNMRLYTIVQTARANGLNVEKYLNYVLNHLDKPILDLLPFSKNLPEELYLKLT